MRMLRSYTLPLAWMGVIFFLSSRQRISVSDVHLVNFVFFKMLHVIEYAVLFVLFVRSERIYCGTGGSRPSYVRAAVLTLAYAAFDELHQVFVPTREGRMRDVIIDAGGIGAGWIFLTALRHSAGGKLAALGQKFRII